MPPLPPLSSRKYRGKSTTFPLNSQTHPGYWLFFYTPHLVGMPPIHHPSPYKEPFFLISCWKNNITTIFTHPIHTKTLSYNKIAKIQPTTILKI
jgi:hypothetical protein